MSESIAWDQDKAQFKLSADPGSYHSLLELLGTQLRGMPVGFEPTQTVLIRCPACKGTGFYEADGRSNKCNGCWKGAVEVPREPGDIQPTVVRDPFGEKTAIAQSIFKFLERVDESKPAPKKRRITL